MKQKGFTLIELLVVIAIIALLATVGITSYRTLNQRARDSRRQSDIQDIRAALEQARTDSGAYPPNLSAIDGTYLDGIPADPGNYSYTYTRVSNTEYTIDYFLEGIGTAQQAQEPL